MPNKQKTPGTRKIQGKGAIFLFLLCALSVFAAQPAQAQLFQPETLRLENGLTVVVLPNHRAPVVTHMLWFKAGAADDPWGKSGIAHFLEHLMFKGTPAYPEGMYSRLISRRGGQENAFTSYDYTAYYATIGKEHLEEVMMLEADRLQNWQVTGEQVARERDVVLKERQQVTENNPVAHFFEDVQAAMYPNSPYQRPVIGWGAEIANLQKKDAEDFVARFYAPNNAILILSGDVTLTEAEPLVRRHYGPIAAHAVQPRARPQAMQTPSRLYIEKTSPLVDEIVWSRHRLVPPARPETVKQSDAQTVLAKILGDSRIGRLYRRLVVEEKMASNAYVSFDPVRLDAARFTLAVTPLPGTDLSDMVAIVDDEISKLVTHGVTVDEVAQATQALDIETLYLRDSVQGPAQIVGTALTSGLDLKTVESWPQRIRAIAKKDVDAAAADLFARDIPWVTAVLRPEAKK